MIYVEIIKNIIGAEAKKYSVNNNLNDLYFENLFSEKKNIIEIVIDSYGLPKVDENKLKEYYKISVREYLSVNPIDIDPVSYLTKKDFKTWLTEERGAKINWNYSSRYFSYLKKSGRADKVLNELMKSSMEILGKLGDPESEKSFYLKGLVVGNVQSGKTQNFNAVINRAIDAGYYLIIVLSGIMEDLRSQTQARIENDIVGEGRDVGTNKLVVKGVGIENRFGPLSKVNKQIEQVVSITSMQSDFNISLEEADFSLNHINILVCKKNISVLKNLIVWLNNYLDKYKEQHNIPLLLIDDEADNASLNNLGSKGREYASKINAHIRVLLEMFKRKAYLGYTATPFANVLQDRNERPPNDYPVKIKNKGNIEEVPLPQVGNIFPDDFIVLLNPPSNYIGAKHIFETIEPINNKIGEKIPLVEVVNDHVEYFPSRVDNNSITGVLNINSQEEWIEKFGEFGSYLHYNDYRDYLKNTRASKPDDDFPKNLCESLKDSIMCFILSIAVRESRKAQMMNSSFYNPHNTMLIHVSRFTNWQNKTKVLLSKYFSKLSADLKNDNPKSSSSIYYKFENIFFKYYANIFETIRDFLPVGYNDEFLSPVSFESLKNYLPEAINNIEIKAINSHKDNKKDLLEYPKNIPKKIIVIGGNRLSRGFTLEGLTVNYFVRTTNYSDTLLQMGRWFGYRPGYLDCCKLFTTKDAIGKFDITTRTIEELEMEFRRMEEKGKTPENFILRVRKHPGTLKITRPSILQNSLEVKWSYQDQLEQTTTFKLKKEKITKIWEVFINQIAGKNHFNKERNDFLTFKTDIAGIINILNLENNFGEVTKNSMIKFLKLCKQKNKLKNWTVAVKRTGDATTKAGKGKLKGTESNLPCDINLSIRRGPEDSKYRDSFINDKIFKASGKSANIVSSGLDFAILLTDEQIKNAKEEFITERKNYYHLKYQDWPEEQVIKKAMSVNIPERVYREKMSDQEGLLVIYLFDSYYVFRQERDKEEDSDFKKMVSDNGYDLNIPLIGYAIGFPPIEPDPGGVYVQADIDLKIDDEDEEADEFSEDDLGKLKE